MSGNRLSCYEKDTINQKYSEGYTQKDIAKLVRRNRGTIQTYIATIFGKVGSGRRTSPITMDNALSAEIGEFIGAFAGDGSAILDKSTYRISIWLNKKEYNYADYLANLINNIGNRKPVKIYRNSNALEVRAYGKELYKFIRTYLDFKSNKTRTVHLMHEITHYTDTFLKYFVRGLVASDGSVSDTYSNIKGKSRRIRISFCSTSSLLAENYSEILKHFDIKSGIYIDRRIGVYPKSVVQTCDKKSLSSFYIKIGLTEENKRKKLENILYRMNVLQN